MFCVFVYDNCNILDEHVNAFDFVIKNHDDSFMPFPLSPFRQYNISRFDRIWKILLILAALINNAICSVVVVFSREIVSMQSLP